MRARTVLYRIVSVSICVVLCCAVLCLGCAVLIAACELAADLFSTSRVSGCLIPLHRTPFGLKRG